MSAEVLCRFLLSLRELASATSCRVSGVNAARSVNAPGKVWATSSAARRVMQMCIMSQLCMLQVENEYGYCGSNAGYIRHLVHVARRILGDSVVLYTTDPPSLAANGSLPGDEVYT